MKNMVIDIAIMNVYYDIKMSYTKTITETKKLIT